MVQHGVSGRNPDKKCTLHGQGSVFRSGPFVRRQGLAINRGRGLPEPSRDLVYTSRPSRPDPLLALSPLTRPFGEVGYSSVRHETDTEVRSVRARYGLFSLYRLDAIQVRPRGDLEDHKIVVVRP